MIVSMSAELHQKRKGQSSSMELIAKTSMNKSGRYEFDYQTDFTQILEEARNNANHVTCGAESGKEQLDHGKKNRKSLKSSLFSWLKTDRKGKVLSNSASLVSKTTVERVLSRGGGAASGPLVGFMKWRRRAGEFEVPYMCLHQINNPQRLQSYGPIYLVT